MQFPEKIKSIKPHYKVLEIGPGATPHQRSDIFLEKNFETEDELINQSGRVGLLKTDKKVVTYDGNTFPFKDKEFDYVICSHVLEHVPNVEFFVNEIQRVGRAGYLEYPTIYYDYLYDIPEHENLLLYNGSEVLWMKKNETNLQDFKIIQSLFYESLNKQYYSFAQELKDYFFQGFEWESNIISKKVSNLSEVCFKLSEVKIKPNLLPKWKSRLINIIKNRL